MVGSNLNARPLMTPRRPRPIAWLLLSVAYAADCGEVGVGWRHSPCRLMPLGAGVTRNAAAAEASEPSERYT